MDSYTMEVSAEARREALLDDAEQRRLIRSITSDADDGRSARVSRPLAVANRLRQLLVPRSAVDRPGTHASALPSARD